MTNEEITEEKAESLIEFYRRDREEYPEIYEVLSTNLDDKRKTSGETGD